VHKYKIKLAYQGTAYSGWQVQKNATSIQSLVQQALSTFLRKTTFVVGSGRTDAGVHALEQVAHFISTPIFDFRRFLISTNALLPPDIRILDVEEVDSTFHARYSAKSKVYRYYIHTSPIRNPFRNLYHWDLHYLPLNLHLIEEAIPFFEGKRNFTSFSNEAHRGSASRNAIRTLKRINLQREEGGIYLEFEADGFLYKMVRNIVGTLVDVALGKITLNQIAEIFDAEDRKRASAAAPALGLFLVSVSY